MKQSSTSGNNLFQVRNSNKTRSKTVKIIAANCKNANTVTLQLSIKGQNGHALIVAAEEHTITRIDTHRKRLIDEATHLKVEQKSASAVEHPDRGALPGRGVNVARAVDTHAVQSADFAYSKLAHERAATIEHLANNGAR